MIPIVMNTPEEMLRVKLIIIKDDTEKALKLLQTAGVLHLEQSKDLLPADKAAIERQKHEAGELLAFTERMLSFHSPDKEKISLGADIEVLYTRPFGEISSEVKALYTRTSRIYDRTVQISDDIKKLDSLKRYLAPLSQKDEFKLSDLHFAGTVLNFQSVCYSC